MVPHPSEPASRIMLVEDDFVIAAELGSNLKNLGYEVCGHLSTTRGVLEMAQEKQPDLILIDIALEKKWDGIEAAVLIRSQLNIPVVFVTAHADGEVLRQAKKALPYGYLLKPFQRADLKVSVEMAFNLALAEKKRRAAEEQLRLQRDLGLALGAVGDLDEAIRMCCSFALKIPGIDCGGVYLLDEETNRLSLAGHVGLSADFVALTSAYEPGSPRTKLVLRGRPVFPDFQDIALNFPAAFREGLTALAVLPVKNENRVFACFTFASRRLESLPAETRDALETLTSQIGGAVARLIAAKALREREELFRELAEYSQAAFSLWDLKKKGKIYLSPAFERIWGRPPDEICRNPSAALEYIHPDDRDRAAVMYSQRNAGQAVEMEYRIVRPDGEVRWVNTSSNPVRNASGEVYRMSSVAEDVTARKAAELELSLHRERLEEMVRRRTEELELINGQLRQEIAERARTEKRLLENQARLRRMGTELLLVEDRERRKLAVLLHDAISQTLFISLLKLKTLAGDRQSPEAERNIAELIEFFESMIKDLRSLTLELSPPILYELGLEPALAWLSEQIEEKYNIAVSFQGDGRKKEASEDVRIFVFRAARELLMNVVKHSRASLAEVFIAEMDGELRLTVEDDGRGFSKTAAESGSETFGLFSISERTKALGGQFELTSNPGRGARATLIIPLETA
ncbi:MAG: PAS domain-containing protein [Pseudomonadota bacterium]